MLSNLSNYCTTQIPTLSAWKAVPFQRRAAVLVILFETFNLRTKQVELSTVLTTRSKNLTSFSGQVALPGGKADYDTESSVTVAHREANEEINFPKAIPNLLSLDGLLSMEAKSSLKEPSVHSAHETLIENPNTPETNGITNLGSFPAYLSRNLLAVAPVITYVPTKASSVDMVPESYHGLPHVLGTNQELSTILSDNGEVSEVFSVPLRHFLYENHPPDSSCFQRYPEPHSSSENGSGLKPWYDGVFTNWNGLQWQQHHYHVLKRTNKKVGDSPYFNVWGLTARILLDVASVAYNQVPEMKHSSVIGDERLLLALESVGAMRKERSKKDLNFSFKKAFGEDSDVLKARL